jgi:DNA replication protein DnaC
MLSCGGFAEWPAVFGEAKITTALLDRFTHRCHILETGKDSYRYRHHQDIKRGETPYSRTGKVS